MVTIVRAAHDERPPPDLVTVHAPHGLDERVMPLGWTMQILGNVVDVDEPRLFRRFDDRAPLAPLNSSLRRQLTVPICMVSAQPEDITAIAMSTR